MRFSYFLRFKKIFAITGLLLVLSFVVTPVIYAADPAAPLATVPSAGTQNGLLSNLPSGEQCLKEGKCTLCDMIQVFVNVGNLILSVFGGIALIFILWNVYGMAQSRGSEEAIRAAKTGIWNTLGGVVVTLIVWQIIGLVIVVFTNLKSVNTTINCSGGSIATGGLGSLQPFSSAKTLKELIGQVVDFFPPAIGAVMLLAFVTNGFKWLTAGGNEEKIKEGIKGMTYAGIALAILFGAYLLLKLIIESFTTTPKSLTMFEPLSAHAQSIGQILNPLTGTDKINGPPGELFARISYMFIRYSGLVYLVMMIYAGFLYLTAQGKEESVTKAKSIVLWSSLAIVAILSAYTLSIFLIQALNPGDILIGSKK